MMSKKINIFDLLALILVGLFVVLFLFAITRPPKDFGEPILMGVRIDQSVETISPEVAAGDTIFVNGINVKSRISDVKIEDGSLDITIEGLGEKDDNLFTFNGQRVLVGQKVELRGRFWAQGLVTSLELK